MCSGGFDPCRKCHPERASVTRRRRAAVPRLRRGWLKGTAPPRREGLASSQSSVLQVPDQGLNVGIGLPSRGSRKSSSVRRRAPRSEIETYALLELSPVQCQPALHYSVDHEEFCGHRRPSSGYLLVDNLVSLSGGRRMLGRGTVAAVVAL